MGDASGVTSSARKDPRKLTTLPDILSTLSSLQSEEAELSNSLGQLLSDREPVNASLSRLDALVSRIDHLYVDANMLQGRVSGTALTAERIGGKVRSLDEEMRRIREAADQVAQVIDLKVCSLVCAINSTFFADSGCVFLVFDNFYAELHGRAGLGRRSTALCSCDGFTHSSHRGSVCGDDNSKMQHYEK